MVDPPSSRSSSVLCAPPMGLSTTLLSQLEVFTDWGLLATDCNLRITFVNALLERQTNLPAGALLGQPLLEAFPSLKSREYDQYYREALQGRSAVLSQRLHDYLLPLPPSAAPERFESMQQTCRIVPLIDGGEICGTLTIIEDVTERVAYESELRELVAALREADRHKDEFLAMLAHELRNPLAPIANAVQILRLSGLNDPLLEGVRDIIERQVTHLVRLVDDLLDVSRVSRGKIELQLSPTDLCAVARHAIETSRPLIDSRRHLFESVIPSHPVFVNGDFVRLAQSVSNLLNNAAKYTDLDGKISLMIETDFDAGHAIVRVRDNGRGIDPSLRENLFMLFYQVDRNLDRSEGGLGIGLALVKSLTEMHGGTIKVESAGSGLGSEFAITLPVLPMEISSRASRIH